MSFGGSPTAGTPATSGVMSTAKAFTSPISAGFQGEMQTKMRERGWVGMMADAQKPRSMLGVATSLGVRT